MSGGQTRQHTRQLAAVSRHNTKPQTFRLFSLTVKRVTNHEKFGDAAKGCGKNRPWPT